MIQNLDRSDRRFSLEEPQHNKLPALLCRGSASTLYWLCGMEGEMSTSTPKFRNIIATASLVTSACFYVVYRGHDRRVLSQEEVAHARDALAKMTPRTSTSSNPSSSSCTTNTQESIAKQHLHNLTKYGVTVVKDTLSPAQLGEWNTKTKHVFDGSSQNNNIVWNFGRAHCSISKRSVHYSDISNIPNYCREDENDAEKNDNSNSKSNSWLARFWGRRKRKTNTDSSTENDDAITHHSKTIRLQDVVQTYFKQHGIVRYELTDLQFLNAYPQSTNQIWHRDNTFRGLTAIVALSDIRDNGPTELILGSHEQQNFSVWQKYWYVMQRYLQTKQSVSNDDKDSILLGCINAGDTILYDARIFHRGRGNNSNNDDVDRPVLVLRWDGANTPPPGCGLILTMANKYIGSMLYASLFALQKLSPSNDKVNK